MYMHWFSFGSAQVRRVELNTTDLEQRGGQFVGTTLGFTPALARHSLRHTKQLSWQVSSLRQNRTRRPYDESEKTNMQI